MATIARVGTLSDRGVGRRDPPRGRVAEQMAGISHGATGRMCHRIVRREVHLEPHHSEHELPTTTTVATASSRMTTVRSIASYAAPPGAATGSADMSAGTTTSSPPGPTGPEPDPSPVRRTGRRMASAANPATIAIQPAATNAAA